MRKNDRDFKVGDILILKEVDLKEGESEQPVFVATGRTLARNITYILHGGQFGIKKGYVVMSIQ